MVEEEEKVPPRVPTPEPVHVPVAGEVTVRYNHYKSKFPILDGVLKEADIDEEYCLSHVYKGNIQMLIREEKDPERRYLP